MPSSRGAPLLAGFARSGAFGGITAFGSLPQSVAKVKFVILEARAFCEPKDLGEPREVARFLRHLCRAFGSLPY
jgi:hypothetical protein